MMDIPGNVTPGVSASRRHSVCQGPRADCELRLAPLSGVLCLTWLPFCRQLSADVVLFLLIFCSLHGFVYFFPSAFLSSA